MPFTEKRATLWGELGRIRGTRRPRLNIRRSAGGVMRAALISASETRRRVPQAAWNRCANDRRTQVLQAAAEGGKPRWPVLNGESSEGPDGSGRCCARDKARRVPNFVYSGAKHVLPHSLVLSHISGDRERITEGRTHRLAGITTG